MASTNGPEVRRVHGRRADGDRESDEMLGLNAEAETLETFIEKLPAMIANLLEESGASRTGDVIPVEVIAHASSSVVFASAA